MEINYWPYNRAKFPNKHVLICEDDLGQQKRITEYFASILEHQGNVICSFVPSAIMAIAILNSCQVDLIILDRDMPWGNGDYIVQWAKGKIPIITFSGSDDNNNFLMERGANYKFGKEDVINGLATKLIKGILGNK